MSFVHQIEYDEAPPEIQRLFRACKKERGFVFNNWKVLAHAPQIMRGFSQFIFAALAPQAVEKRIVELAILKTSLLNQCRY